MEFTNDYLRLIYNMIMGYGTEAVPGKNPYTITVCANKRKRIMAE